MNIFLIGLITFCILGMVVCAINIIRIEMLSNNLQKIIDEVYENHMAAIKTGKTRTEIKDTINYPDIHASYNNLKWYKPWERPSTLIVYDKEVI